MSSIQKNNEQEVVKSEEYKKLIATKENIKVGDLFIEGANDRLIVISKIEEVQHEKGDYICVHTRCVDFYTLEQSSHDWDHEEINAFIKTYSHKYVPDFEEYKRKAREYLYEGKPFEIEVHENENEFGLMYKTNKAMLEVMHSDIDLKTRNLEILRNMTQLMINEQKSKLDLVRRKMEEQISIFQKEMKKIMKVIGLIELYLGIEEELFQLTSGEPADKDEPLSLRQLVIYADEELGNCDDGGIDFKQLDKFDNWLISNDNYKRLLPEKRGIVALKPRRIDKHYSDNPTENSIANQWNHETYFMIRNGDNIYRICSPNIGVGETMYPKKDELAKLMDAENLSTFEKHNEKVIDAKMEAFNDKYMKMFLFIQGLLDRTEVFAPIMAGIKVTDIENGGLNLIYDAEPSLMDGKRSYSKWVEEVNQNVGRGSRIVLVPSYGRNSFNDSENYNYRRYGHISEGFVPYYKSRYSCPSPPQDGLYIVDEIKTSMYKDGKQEDITVPVIRYMPDESVWSWSGSHERKVRITWAIDYQKSTYLNYDRMCIEDIDYYLNSRFERKNYLGILPVLRNLKKHLLEEQTKESDFKLMLKGMVMKKYPKMTEKEIDELISESIDWWKFKNIWKRPITQDDKKAVRMIQQKLKI